MNSDSLNFRKALSTDAEALSLLINSAYRGDSARKGWTHEAELVGGLRTTPEELNDIISTPGEWFLVAEGGGGIVGAVHVKDEGMGLYFGMLAVSPVLQNRKLGSGLMDEITRIGRSLKKSYLRIAVIHLRQELISYYERKGFHLTGTSEPFPEKYPAKLPGLKLLEMKKTL